MKRLLAAAALVLVAPAIGGCGSDGGSTATDPGGPSASTPAGMPTAVPAAPGTVDTAGVATVMDTGTPELCLGAVADSYPPQCTGPRIDGWDWADHHGMYESQQGIRWGAFQVSGTWDGSTLTFENAVAAPVYDPMPTTPADRPTPSVRHSQGELEAIAHEVDGLPGAQGAYPDHGQVLVDVVYDDGSLQAWADRTYGSGVVVVSPLLLDREE